jgi:Leucine-rich repeat (LRR) protein
MSGRFRASSSKWDWPKGSPPKDMGSPDEPKSGQRSQLNASRTSKSKSTTKRGKYAEPEAGFFFCSEDGQQVLICGKSLEAADVAAMAAVIARASVVNLSHNSLAAIPTGLPPAITALDLSKNQLSHLYGLENVTNLRELYLGGNHIESTWGLTIATSLEILDLSANNIKLIEGLETLTKLKRLNLKYNNIKGMSAIRSLSFNKKLLVLDLSSNPVAENSNYKRNMLHLIPSLEVLDDLKIGFEMFRKNNDYTTRYLNTKQFNESRDSNGFGFLWSGRPGRWDGVVFQAANSTAMNAQELRALSDACAGSQVSELYGTKQDAKKYPWRQEPDIEPRPLQFYSAAEENVYRSKTPTKPKPFSPHSHSSQRPGVDRAGRSPTSYMAMSQDESYLNTVLSQHMERPEWNKFYKPTKLGTESKVAKQRVEEERRQSKKNSQRLDRSVGGMSSSGWLDDGGARGVYMGGPMSPATAASHRQPPSHAQGQGQGQGHGQQYFEYNDEQGTGYDEGGGDPDYYEGNHDSNEFYMDEPETGEYGENDEAPAAEKDVFPKELEETLLELVEHKKALLRKLQENRAARNS